MLSFSSGASAVGPVGRVCCLGLDFAGQGLGHGTASNTWLVQDARASLVEELLSFLQKESGYMGSSS
jgi:hypothetical protein